MFFDANIDIIQYASMYLVSKKLRILHRVGLCAVSVWRECAVIAFRYRC